MSHPGEIMAFHSTWPKNKNKNKPKCEPRLEAGARLLSSRRRMGDSGCHLEVGCSTHLKAARAEVYLQYARGLEVKVEAFQSVFQLAYPREVLRSGSRHTRWWPDQSRSIKGPTEPRFHSQFRMFN
jgi:hypothetical protein